MEGRVQWLAKQQEELQKTLQGVQQSHQVERQALLVWQAEQQKTLQDFIREQANIQQQLLHWVVTLPRGDGNHATGLGLYKMGSADDPDAFLCTFEWVAMAASWDKVTLALRLAPYLASEVQVAYSNNQARDYEMVKAAVLDRMGLLAEKYKQKLRATRWTGALRRRAFAPKLTDWATRWLRSDTQTVGKIMDHVILKKFVQGLTENMWVWVQRHQLTTMEAAIKMTEEYAEADFSQREAWTGCDQDWGKKPQEPPPGRDPY
ncbi:uncharacterized protein LOC120379862 [Mauremys reevesii]|uniref:uncharacterized protein LOC120379862 n=1 Tax=Mauremys reevesii TaxID=260615 RepID=UPI00193FE053|nr:uncharacterized protein LOC120379862 [Mauremys reevesii]